MQADFHHGLLADPDVKKRILSADPMFQSGPSGTVAYSCTMTPVVSRGIKALATPPLPPPTRSPPMAIQTPRLKSTSRRETGNSRRNGSLQALVNQTMGTTLSRAISTSAAPAMANCSSGRGRMESGCSSPIRASERRHDGTDARQSAQRRISSIA
jgi:hypothetical protein